MTNYMNREGTKFEASSATDLVEQLRQTLLSSSATLQDFMNQMAHRFQVEENFTIKTIDPEMFIADLIQHDYLSVIDPIDG